jgi:tetratricopeptide (TPR) repeat protein
MAGRTDAVPDNATVPVIGCLSVANPHRPAQNEACTCTSFSSGNRIVARPLVLRIAGALLIGLALCPLVPLLGRPQWPAWVGPFLGALFGLAMFRTKSAVKIAAALALGFTFNVFREFAGEKIIDLTRFSLPLGFFAGWAVYVLLAVVSNRARLKIAVAGVLSIAGVTTYQYGVIASIHGRYQEYLAERSWQALLRSKTVGLPTVDHVEIAAGIPATHGQHEGWKPGVPVVLTGRDAEQIAAIWRRRKFREADHPYNEPLTQWYVKFSAQGKLLLDTEIKPPELLCLLHGIDPTPGKECYVFAEDSWDALQENLRHAAPFPDVTQSVFECIAATTKSDSGDFTGAIEAFETAIRLDPQNGDAFAGMAKAYLKVHDYERAIKAFTSAVQLLPSDPSLFHERGATYLLRGKYHEAIDDFSQALKISSYNPSPTLDLRGQAYLRLGKADEALADFRAALVESPDVWNFQFHKEEAVRMQGAKAKAPTTAK